MFELVRLLVGNRPLAPQCLDATPTSDGLRLHLSTLQFSVSPSALDSKRGEHNRYLRRLQSLTGQVDFSHSNFTTLATLARDSRPSFCYSAGPLPEKILSLWTMMMPLKTLLSILLLRCLRVLLNIIVIFLSRTFLAFLLSLPRVTFSVEM